MRDPSATRRRRSVLICHAESRLNREGIARWLASVTDLVGLVVIEEGASDALRRIRREVKRVGFRRFLDVLAFRVYYAARHARRDARWLSGRLDALAALSDLPPSLEVLRTSDPNGPEVERFMRRLSPDFAVARCKRILHKRIYSVPANGTFVLHPGVCPEYRNAHGAFWALARRDLDRVGLTLLRIDDGIDTGPVYAYFSYEFDEVHESHIVIMSRLVLDNLNGIRDALLDVLAGRISPIDTTGRLSMTWGQPWLTEYLRWKRQAASDRTSRTADARPVA
jgi:methionyl-tRNA formyltransferase